jgi:hypothetical protein
VGPGRPPVARAFDPPEAGRIRLRSAGDSRTGIATLPPRRIALTDKRGHLVVDVEGAFMLRDVDRRRELLRRVWEHAWNTQHRRLGDAS